MMKIQTYSQTDSKWSKVRLEPSNLTIGDSGCVAVAVCMAMGNWAYDWTPDRLVSELIDHNGFTLDGYLIWDALVRATKGNVYFHDRVSTVNMKASGLHMGVETAISNVRRLLDLGQPTCLHVDAQKNDGKPDHFIVAYDYAVEGGKVTDLKVKDPWNGKHAWFSDLYGDMRTGLYGYVALIGPPIEFPDQSVQREGGKALWKAAQIAQGINVGTYSREIIDTLI